MVCLKGPVQVKIRAWNVFSSLEAELLGSGGNSAAKQKASDGHLLGFNNKTVFYFSILKVYYKFNEIKLWLFIQ